MNIPQLTDAQRRRIMSDWLESGGWDPQMPNAIGEPVIDAMLRHRFAGGAGFPERIVMAAAAAQ